MPKKKLKPLWMPKSVGDVVAERDFDLVKGSGRKTRLRVRFGRPVRGKGTLAREPWWCPIEVKGGGIDSFRPVAGIDSLQALVLALDFATRVLPREVEQVGFKIEWLGRSEQLVLARQAMSREVEAALLTLFGTMRDVASILSSSDQDERRATQALRRIMDATQFNYRSQKKRTKRNRQP